MKRQKKFSSVLTTKQWRRCIPKLRESLASGMGRGDAAKTAANQLHRDEYEVGMVLALANYALPDDDRHKCSWESVDFLLQLNDEGATEHAEQIAYLLPPRGVSLE